MDTKIKTVIRIGSLDLLFYECLMCIMKTLDFIKMIVSSFIQRSCLLS